MQTEKAGKTRDEYKKNNRGKVLQLIATGMCANRTQLTQAMGLSKMAITKIVGEMLQMGLLSEKAPVLGDEPGRSPVGLCISENAPKVVGLLIQREYCEAVLCDFGLQILKRETVYYGDKMDRDMLMSYVYRVLDTILYGESNVLGIGVSSVGPVSSSTGMILKPFYFFGIRDVPISTLLQERYALPVFLDHDNQCAAIVEYLYGNARGYSDVLYLGVGSGIGCGIISNGHRYRNERGLPPEIGHVTIDMKGRRCLCGSRGCVEMYARTPEVLKKLQYHSGRLYDYKTYCGMTDDPLAERILMDMVDQLSAATVSAVNILNTQILILGNDAIDWDIRYVHRMEELINERRFVEWSDPGIGKKAFFRKDAFVLGAACIVLTQVFRGDMLFD